MKNQLTTVEVGDFTLTIGSCGCGAKNVPVASDEYYTHCVSCLRKIVDVLEQMESEQISKVTNGRKDL